jgi:predicted patatin/cPLA2 family phospholipase
MKRSDITITIKDHLKELRRELTMRWAVFTKEVKAKRLTEYEANKRYLIIQQHKELVEEMEKKEISWNDLMQMVESLPPKRRVTQSRMKFPS